MANWTFITNHGAVLAFVAKRPKVRAIAIARELGLTERSVRRIISDLVAEGYLDKEREGAVNRYTANPRLSLRRPEMQDIKIRDLIELLSSKTRNGRATPFKTI